MSEKSHVSMEMAMCPVCCNKHSTGILFHKRLKPVLERETVTHWDLCPNCKKLKDDGYIALVGIDPDRSESPYTPKSVWRTGEVAHLRSHVFYSMFGDEDIKVLAFCPASVIEQLKQASAEAEAIRAIKKPTKKPTKKVAKAAAKKVAKKVAKVAAKKVAKKVTRRGTRMSPATKPLP